MKYYIINEHDINELPIKYIRFLKRVSIPNPMIDDKPKDLHCFEKYNNAMAHQLWCRECGRDFEEEETYTFDELLKNAGVIKGGDDYKT
jgi:hypothetical protein|tara:strand:+ start:2238 stop:2504 length:267 start_codon:yes stop_codon:yes gene_type:complete